MANYAEELMSIWEVDESHKDTIWKTWEDSAILFDAGITGILGETGMAPAPNINKRVELSNNLREIHRATYKIFKGYDSYGKKVYEEATYVYIRAGSFEDPVYGYVLVDKKDANGDSLYEEQVTSTTENTATEEDTKETVQGQAEEGSRAYVPNLDIFEFNSTNEYVEDSEFAKLKNVAGVFGLPYQFLPNTDNRLNTTYDIGDIGFEYGTKIVEKMPLLFMSPGRASFLSGYSSSDKESIAMKFIDDAASSIEDIINGKAGRYYTFEYDTARYYKFVNPMCRIAARYLELQDFQLYGTNLDEINWMDFIGTNISSLGDVISEFLAIPFYMDAETSVQESFSNTTTTSMLASTVNGLSDAGKELNFLLGYTQSAANIDVIRNQDIAGNVENATDFIKGLLGEGHFFSRLSSTVATVAAGGRMIFPEIWSESSVSRSFNCEFKFISPDPSTLSVYLNVLVPLFHLLGFVAPQSVSTDPNTYVNPFLVRAIYKGHFNVDMGIITDMSVTRGDECQWTINGIPTSIKVSMTIKDLYSVLSITQTGTELDFDTLDNTAQMDYIANLCGVNIYKPEIARIADMWLVNNIKNRVSDIVNINLWGNIQTGLQNQIMKIFRN